MHSSIMPVLNPQAQIFGAELYPGGFAFVSGVENPRVDFRFIVEIDPPTGMSKYNSSTELSLYPNPVEDMVHLTFSADEPTDATVRVLDIQGRAVLSEQLGTVSGKHVTTLDVQALSPGMYHVLLQTESGTAVRQLMVH